MQDLKDYRNKELKWYIIGNILIMVYQQNFLNGTFSEKHLELIKIIVSLFDSALISAIIYTFSFLLDSLFSSNFKFALLYLKLSHMPGETIFSDIKNKHIDNRFTQEQALQKYIHIYENMPTDTKMKYIYENAKWYNIYHRYKDIAMIFQSNRDYLLCRDIYISTIIVFILYITSTCFFKFGAFSVRYILYLVIMLLISNVSARFKGKRFAYNVIAQDIQNDQ